MDDRAEVKFFRGEAGKSLAQVVADLSAEYRDCASAGAVGAVLAVFHHITEQAEVGIHAPNQAMNPLWPARLKLRRG